MSTPLARSAAKLALSFVPCATLAHLVLPPPDTLTPAIALAFTVLGGSVAFTFLYAVITLWLLLEKLFGKDRF